MLTSTRCPDSDTHLNVSILMYRLARLRLSPMRRVSMPLGGRLWSEARSLACHSGMPRTRAYRPRRTGRLSSGYEDSWNRNREHLRTIMKAAVPGLWPQAIRPASSSFRATEFRKASDQFTVPLCRTPSRGTPRRERASLVEGGRDRSAQGGGQALERGARQRGSGIADSRV
jgi:hypothetical protein